MKRGQIIEEATVISETILDFLEDRLKVQQREAGVRHDLIDAVFALGDEDDLVRLVERGELTPTLKVKRKTVHANHGDVIESLYS